jgi:RNase H-fold protein (predicted Holliday junction resolvase)
MSNWGVYMFDLAVIKEWVGMANIVFTAIVGLVVHLNSKDKTINTRISQFETSVDSRLDGHSDRLTKLESRVSTMPTHEDLKQLSGDIKKQSEKLDQLLGESKARSETMRMIHEYLLERKQ